MIEPQTATKLKMPLNAEVPPGNVVEMPFVFTSFKKPVRSEISIVVKFSDLGREVSDVQGFVINPMTTNPKALIKFYGKEQVRAKDWKVPEMDPNAILDLVRFGFSVPQTINGRAVDWIRIERIYILFEDNDQIFQPINNAIVIKR